MTQLSRTAGGWNSVSLLVFPPTMLTGKVHLLSLGTLSSLAHISISSSNLYLVFYSIA